MKALKLVLFLCLLAVMSPFIGMFLGVMLLKHAYLVAEAAYDALVEWL